MSTRSVTTAIIALSVIGALSLGIPVMARQWGPGPGGNGGPHGAYGPHFRGGKPFRHLDRMQYYLGLSDEQVEKIFKIEQHYREKLFKNRNNYDAVQDLRVKKRKEIENMLTEEQKKRYNEFFPCRYDDRFKRGSKKSGPRGY